MAKVTVYYFTCFDKDTGETVRPRRPGTLAAIGNIDIEDARPLMRTAKEVDESDLDEWGFYLGRYRSLQRVGGRDRELQK